MDTVLYGDCLLNLRTLATLGRQYLGCELNADNAPLIAERLANA